MNNRPHFAGTSNKGFSLLELLLVLVIVLLLFGAAVFEFNSMSRGASLSEGANQLESLFLFARNEAERTGKLVRIRFGPTEAATSFLPEQENATNTIEADETKQSFPVIEWEPNPIKLPGQFKPLPNSNSFTEGINELVKFETIDLSGLDAQISSISTSENPQAGSLELLMLTEPAFSVLHFYPDGSCNSAKVQLADRDPRNPNKSIVELIGFTGTVKHQLIEIIPKQSTGADTNKLDKTDAPLDQPELEP